MRIKNRALSYRGIFHDSEIDFFDLCHYMNYIILLYFCLIFRVKDLNKQNLIFRLCKSEQTFNRVNEVLKREITVVVTLVDCNGITL